MWSNQPTVNDEYDKQLINFKLELKNNYKIYYPVELEKIYKEYIDFIKTNKSNKKIIDLINNKIKLDLNKNKKIIKTELKQITLYF
jgi:hypothetical protein